MADEQHANSQRCKQASASPGIFTDDEWSCQVRARRSFLTGGGRVDCVALSQQTPVPNVISGVHSQFAFLPLNASGDFSR